MSRLPKWFVDMREKESESVKAKANKQEKDFAKRASNLGARRQPASGAFWSAKGDVRIGGLALGDNKFTKYKSLSVTKEMWEKVKREAMEQNIRIPFLQIEMAETDRLVVLDENDFLMLLENYMDV